METTGRPPVDPTKASIARVYDAMLNGKDNYEVDRAIRDQITEFAPEMLTTATDGRGFLSRVTHYLTHVHGIDQFLDLGSGLPTAENTHQVAQRVNPDSEVVYVDNDPVVLAHGRALLEENARTCFVSADLTRPDEVLDDEVVRRHLDFSRPMALYQIGTLHHVSDEDDPPEIMRRYIEALPSGSFVALAHFFNPRDGSEVDRTAARIEQICTDSSMATGWFRTAEQITGLLAGSEVLPPGPGLAAEPVPVADWWSWGPHPEPLELARRAYVGLVGRKP